MKGPFRGKAGDSYAQRQGGGSLQLGRAKPSTCVCCDGHGQPRLPHPLCAESPAVQGAPSLVDGHCNVLHEAYLQLRDVGLLTVHHLHRPVAHGLLLRASSHQAWPSFSIRHQGRVNPTPPSPRPGTPLPPGYPELTPHVPSLPGRRILCRSAPERPTLSSHPVSGLHPPELLHSPFPRGHTEAALSLTSGPVFTIPILAGGWPQVGRSVWVLAHLPPATDGCVISGKSMPLSESPHLSL